MKINFGLLLLSFALIAQFTFTSADVIIDSFESQSTNPDPRAKVDLLTCSPPQYYSGAIQPDLRSYIQYTFNPLSNTTIAVYPNLYCSANFIPSGGFCLGGVRRIVVATQTAALLNPVQTSSSIFVRNGTLFQAVGPDLAAATYISYFGNVTPNTTNCTFPNAVQCASQLVSGPLLPVAYDLTENGIDQAFAFTIVFADHIGSSFIINAWSSYTAVSSRLVRSVAQKKDPSEENYDGEIYFYDFPLGYTVELSDGRRATTGRRYVIPFSAFTRLSTAQTLANWAAIRGFQFIISADVGLDTIIADFRTVPLVTSAKSANITESIVVDNIAEPGEVINYSILISVATGLPTGEAVTNTFFYDNPYEFVTYGTLVPGSVNLQAFTYIPVNCSTDVTFNTTSCIDSWVYDPLSFGASILTAANNPAFANRVAVFFPTITGGSYVYVNYQVLINNLPCAMYACNAGCSFSSQTQLTGGMCYCNQNQGRTCLNVGINQTSSIATALDAAGNGSTNVPINGCTPTTDTLTNSFITTTPIGANPNPAIVLTANPAQKAAGVLPCNAVNFTFTLTNNRSRSSDAFVVSLTPDANLNCAVGAGSVNPNFTADATTGFPVYSVPSGLQYGATLTVPIVCNVSCTLACGVNSTTLIARINFGTNTVTCPEDIIADDVSQDSVPLIGSPSLTLTKQNATAITISGTPNTATFTINYANTGARVATGVVITETIPAALASFYVASDNTAWTSIGNNSYTYSIASIGANSAGSTSFTYRVPNVLTDCTTGSYPNTVSVNGVCGGQSVSAVAYVNVNAVPDLAITIPNVTAPTSVISGSSVCYNVQYQNIGYRVGQSVVINVNLPSFTTFASTGSAAYTRVGTSSVYTLSVGSVAGQSGVTVVPFCVTVAANTACASSFAFSANITTVCAGFPETNLANNFASAASLTIASNVVLTLSKVATINGAQAFNLTPGATVVYNISGSNTGSSQATNVTITENLPAGTTIGANSLFTAGASGSYSYSVGTVNAGSTFGPVSFSVVVPSSVPCPAPSVANVATVSETCTGATASANLTLPIIASPVLSMYAPNVTAVVLATNNQTCVSACYTNTGNQVANSAVMTLSAGAYATFINGSAWTLSGNVLSYNVGNIAVGANTCSPAACFAVTTPIPCGVNSVAFNFTLTSPCYTAAPVVASTTVAIIAFPEFRISKSNNVVGEASPGQAVVYTITYQNVGYRVAENTVLTESVPTLFNAGTNSGFTCSGSSCTYPVGTLSPTSGQQTLRFAGTLTSNVPGTSTVTNNVSIVSQPCNASNSAISTLTVAGYPNLVVTKTDNGATGTPGQYITYTITYANNGDTFAPNTILTETIPAFTVFNRSLSSAGFNCADGVGAGTVCNISLGSVAVGASGTVTLVVKVDDWVRCGINFTTNFVNISTTIQESNYADNADSEETPLMGSPDLVITKTTNRTSGRSGRAGPGDLITYNIEYKNTGLRDAVGTIIYETVPQYTTYNAAASSGNWSCADGSPAGTVCTIDLGTIYPMMPGMDNMMAEGMFNFSVNVITSLPPDAHLTTNCVYINNTCDDCNLFDNMACTPVILYGVPDLILNQTAICRSIHWFVEWSNVGDQSASNAIITDSVPASTMFNAAASDSRWSCNTDTSSVNYGQCTLNVGTIGAGAGGSAVFVTNPMNGSTATTYSNTASITGTGTNPDPTPENNQDTATVGFEGCPDACDSCCPIANTCCPDKTEVLFTFAGILDGLSQCSSTS